MGTVNQSAVVLRSGDQSIELQQKIDQNTNSTEAKTAKAASETQAAKSKAAFKTTFGADMGSDPTKFVSSASHTSSSSGGGGSNPLSALVGIASAVLGIASGVGTITAAVNVVSNFFGGSDKKEGKSSSSNRDGLC
jgi:hypothetical protein